MSKVAFLLVSFCLVSVAQAEGKRFTLKCTPDKSLSHVPAHVSSYKVAKVVTKPSTTSKWVTKYVLEVYFKSQPSKAYEYPFVPAGSGDEDYVEYDVKGSDAQLNRINVKSAYIQNQFRWVNLIDNDGMGFADCR